MTVPELYTVKTAYLFKELISEISKMPNGWALDSAVATRYLFKEFISEIE